MVTASSSSSERQAEFKCHWFKEHQSLPPNRQQQHHHTLTHVLYLIDHYTKCLNFYRDAHSSTSASTSSAKQPLSILAEYQKYLAMRQCGDDIPDCLLFWIKNMTELPNCLSLL